MPKPDIIGNITAPLPIGLTYDAQRRCLHREGRLSPRPGVTFSIVALKVKPVWVENCYNDVDIFKSHMSAPSVILYGVGEREIGHAQCVPCLYAIRPLCYNFSNFFFFLPTRAVLQILPPLPFCSMVWLAAVIRDPYIARTYAWLCLIGA